MSNQTTFWELLKSNNIEIPIIQRDYAQGRDNNKVKQIRESFVATLYEMVVHTGKSKDLDFIYGSLEGGKLILLDGQQRLTTLFLLHWYLAVVCTKTEELDRLKKFTYKTRVTSNEFCNALTDIERGGTLEIIGEKKLSKIIENSSWFFSIWKFDPTIKSMLVMLDEIHDVFQDDKNFKNDLWSQLIDKVKPPITFYFLNMHDFKLTDELYIKMNARGRPLSEFENFKAWLQEYSNKKEIKVSKLFWESFDKEWTDLFWNNNRNYEIDDVFMQFFKSIFLSEYALQQQNTSKKMSKKVDSIIVLLRDGKEYVTYDVYEKILDNIGEFFDTITVILDFLSINSSKNKLLENILREKPNYLNHTQFYSLCIFITTCTSPDEQKLQQWLRITRNLTQNIAYDSSMDFANAVQSINNLAKDLLITEKDIYTKLATMSNTEISFFDNDQIKEEILKANLILEDEKWEKSLRLFEIEDYFYGQVGFLLQYSKKEDQYNRKIFKEYGRKAATLFSPQFLKKDGKGFLLERALLTKGDYTIKKGSNWSFCLPSTGSARERNENWRQVFNDEEGSKYLKRLLENLNEDDIENNLKVIINNSMTNSWRQYFIKCPEVLKYCGKRQIRFVDDNHIYLLSSVRMSGKHAELRTYIRYRIYKKEALPGMKIKYHYVDTDKEEPYVFVELNNKSLQLSYEKMKYIVKIDDGTTTFYGANPPTINDVRKFLL